jgi:predicted AlkP superfamily pyrophosphatase or phosphodiesterase
MRLVVFALIAVFSLLPLQAQRRKVVLISIDGLRGVELASAPTLNWDLPNLSEFVTRGAVSEGMIGVLPTVTAPSTASIVTGVSPSVHGIPTNFLFDPERKMTTEDSGNEYAELIHVPTLWTLAHAAGLRTASAYWPTTIGAPIDADFPNHAPMKNDRDRMIYRAISTPGLVVEYEKKYGELPVGATAFDDHVVTQMALFLMQSRKPDFLFVYFQDFDHAEHKYGPDSPEAIRALKSIDTDIGTLRKAIAAAGFEKQTDIVIVSDHGFLPLSQSFHPNAVLASLNLLGPKGHPEQWRVTSFGGGGSFGLVVHDPNDQAAMDLATKTFQKLKQQGCCGIDQIFDREQLKAAKGYATSFLAIGMKPGFSADGGDEGSWVTPSQGKGAHGYPPGPPNLDAAFAAIGPGIPHVRLSRAHIVDVAPTVAALLGLRMTNVEGTNLLPASSKNAAAK